MILSLHFQVRVLNIFWNNKYIIVLIKTSRWRVSGIIIRLILGGGNHNMCLNIMFEVKCQVGHGMNVCVLAISMNIATVFESINELLYRTPLVFAYKN